MTIKQVVSDSKEFKKAILFVSEKVKNAVSEFPETIFVPLLSSKRNTAFAKRLNKIFKETNQKEYPIIELEKFLQKDIGNIGICEDLCVVLFIDNITVDTLSEIEYAKRVLDDFGAVRIAAVAAIACDNTKASSINLIYAKKIKELESTDSIVVNFAEIDGVDSVEIYG